MHARRLALAILLVAATYLVSRTARPLAIEIVRPDVTPITAGAAPATLDDLEREIAAVIEREGVPGVAIALVGRDGPVWIRGIGVRDLATKAPVEPDTVFRVGSLSKAFVALAVMRLVDQGKLDVDRPLREILPDAGIDNPWEAVAPVTLAHCLEHTAGLDDVRFNEVFTEDEHLSVAATLRLNPRSRRVRWRPGTRHAYSNVGYTLAARAVEVATGEPFDVYLRREIFAPLGITDADFARTPALTPRLANGYYGDDRVAPFAPFAHRPSGGLLASAEDLAKLVQFWIRRGDGYSIVSPAGLARIERRGTLPYGHLDSDYGFAIYGDVSHPTIGYGHDGGMLGFHAAFRYFPALEGGYVMLLNANYSFRGYREIRKLLYAYLARDRAIEPPAVATTRTSEPPGASYFEHAAPRSQIFGFIEQVSEGWAVTSTSDGIVVRERDQEPYLLVPTPDGAYRHRSHSGSFMRFVTAADGTPLLVTGFSYGEAGSAWFAHARYYGLGAVMMLLKLAPLWAAAMLLLGVLGRRRALPLSLLIWPALAGLACGALPHLLELSFLYAVVGTIHALTVGLFITTLVLGLSSVATLVATLRCGLRPDRPRWIHLALPLVFGVAFTAFSLWLFAHGWIGLRTWAY